MTLPEEKQLIDHKLNLETAKINWKGLEVYFAKGVLIKVENGFDLVKIASQIASNQHEEIEKSIKNQELEFFTTPWIKKHCSSNPDFWAVVVSPYVICQLAAAN